MCLKQKSIRIVREMQTIFPYGQYINRIAIVPLFYDILCYEIEVGIYEKFAKM